MPMSLKTRAYGSSGRSDARIIIGTDQLLPLRLWREKRSEIENPGRSDNLKVTRLSCPVSIAYRAFLAILANHPPRLIPIDADSLDLQDRAEHLNALFGGLAAYLAVVLDDTAQNTPGSLDLRDAEAILADVAADLTGAIQGAADQMADEMGGRVE